MIEGTVCNVPTQGGYKHFGNQCIEIDTAEILFICGGAFHGLEGIVSQRLGKRNIGFGTGPGNGADDIGKVLHHTTPDDLIQFGLIPEFVGRLPVVATLDSLTVDDLVCVLTKPTNALLKEYRKLCQLHGADVRFTDAAIREIARVANEKGTGARGLRGLLEAVMEDIIFNLSDAKPGQRFLVTDRVVRGECQARSISTSPLGHFVAGRQYRRSADRQTAIS